MRIIRACVLGLLAAVLASCEHESPSAPDVLAVKQDNVIPYEQKRLNGLQMRDFLWTHWLQRRPATLLLTSVSKEGARYYSEYKIINLPGNTLTLKFTVIHDRVGAFGKVIPKPIASYEAYTVERVLSDDPIIGSESKVTVLANDVTAAPEKYRLRFKGWGNEVVGYF